MKMLSLPISGFLLISTCEQREAVLADDLLESKRFYTKNSCSCSHSSGSEHIEV